MGQISYSDSNTNMIMTPVLDFHCLFDIDFSILYLIRKKYYDISVFSKDFFENNKSIVNIVKQLSEREDKNPLRLCTYNSDDADSLYKEFLEKNYDEVLAHIMRTEVYNLMNGFKLGDIKPTIYCHNEAEVKFCNTLIFTANLPVITEKDLTPQTISIYQQWFLKYIDEGLIEKIYDKVSINSIYVASYPFNIDQENRTIRTNKYTAYMAMNKNRFCIFDIYNKYKLAKGENKDVNTNN